MSRRRPGTDGRQWCGRACVALFLSATGSPSPETGSRPRAPTGVRRGAWGRLGSSEAMQVEVQLPDGSAAAVELDASATLSALKEAVRAAAGGGLRVFVLVDGDGRVLEEEDVQGLSDGDVLRAERGATEEELARVRRPLAGINSDPSSYDEDCRPGPDLSPFAAHASNNNHQRLFSDAVLIAALRIALTPLTTLPGADGVTL
eukprot:TRINITY_DN8053_c0_g1_i3.p1 TRINITY_DN8053_c0_g1~~TRINITY_DN8053_c0_g1_i3.p1  ORF type:complete len:203 (+),score=20.67 TRINITY_DN8053_c0_g1_i3:205-813(+)